MGIDIAELKSVAKELRQDIFKMIYHAGGGHISPAYSIVEILTALYFGGILKIDPYSYRDADRDRFILSKGHASAALYAALAKVGFFQKNLLEGFCKKDSVLGGHPNMLEIPGVEASTGALGHGLSFALGIALAGKLDEKSYHTFVIIGDGECQEGSIWEAALSAAQLKLGNLTVILDFNQLQAMGELNEIVRMEPFAQKWKSFGWNVVEVDGHDLEALIKALKPNGNFNYSPKLIIAHTIKGKGVSFMENQPLWHYRLPNPTELQGVLNELDIKSMEILP